MPISYSSPDELAATVHALEHGGSRITAVVADPNNDRYILFHSPERHSGFESRPLVELPDTTGGASRPMGSYWLHDGRWSYRTTGGAA